MPSRDQTLGALADAIGEKYDVLEWVGGGGMADVFLAQHRLHGGFCAVKVLADQLSHDSAIVERFLQEARTAANLEGHPNVVRIIDIGESRGLFYLIMPFVEGEDLASYLERAGRLTPEQAVYAITQVAEALAWAHSKGVVHRDLKPANVRLNRNGRLIVLDFGIAKATSVPSALTMAGEKLGTPYYMAPEQIRGENVDFRSDLYSLGVLAFELLTGRKPFEGETYHAIEYAHLNTPPPGPDELEPSVTPELADVVLRLLEKDPEARYQSAGELIQDLKPFAAVNGASSLRPEVSHDLEQWREAEPAVSASSFAARAPAVPAPPVPGEPPHPAESPPAPEKQHGGPRTWPIFAGGGAVIIAALGTALYFGSVDPRPAPGEPYGGDPSTPKRKEGPPSPAPAIETSTGEMVLVPAGAFTFGHQSSESPNPLQTLMLGDFYIDGTEVSNAAYKRFCDETGHSYPEPPPGDSRYFDAKPDHPVVNVTHEDALSYAAWAEKRLPTEAEWEKAARGPQGQIYPWGMATPAKQANVRGGADSYSSLAPVDSFAQGASPYGALHMAGNVWEWTLDSYSPTSREVEAMKEFCPEGADQKWNVAKGGSADSARDDLDLRAYFRTALPAKCKSPLIGFRCVKNVN